MEIKGHNTFQENTKKALEKIWNIKLSEKKINICGLLKTFDYVSEDEKYIGDSKFFKNLKTPSAEFSTIAEYVWLLEKTSAEKKFLVFGNDIKVPERWLSRFGYITNVEFYFYDMKDLKLLSSNKLKTAGKSDIKKNNILLDLSVWEDKDFNYLKDLRKDMNKWKMKY